MKQEFPRWKYHETQKPEGKIFETEAAFLAAGKGWVDSPAYFSQVGEVLTVKMMKDEQAKAEAEQLSPSELAEISISETLAEMADEVPVKKYTKKPR